MGAASVVLQLALFPALVGAFLEYLFCRVRGLGWIPPALTGLGIIGFLAYDQRHAEQMLANGQMPEALGLAAGLSLLGGLLAGMILGGILYHVIHRKG